MIDQFGLPLETRLIGNDSVDLIRSRFTTLEYAIRFQFNTATRMTDPVDFAWVPLHLIDYRICVSIQAPFDLSWQIEPVRSGDLLQISWIRLLS